MNDPRVSIILPTYNRSKLIDECVKCVLTQDFTDWELIILDDNSSDDTPIICKKLEEEYDNITYHRNIIRKGLPGNRNSGIDVSKGELVLFIEDDLLLNDFCLKTLVETYDELKEDEKIGGIAPRLIVEGLRPFKQKQSSPFIINKFTGEIYTDYSINLDAIKEVPTVHACSLYKKEALKEVGGYNETVYKGNYKREESDLNFRLLKLGYKFYFQPKAAADHIKVDYGGCRVNSKTWEAYYIVRNHIVFVIRIFGIKSIFMIPLFLISISYKFLLHFLKG